MPINTTQPALTLRYVVVNNGIYPSRDGGFVDQGVGHIRLFGTNFAPGGTFETGGSLLPIQQYAALFSLVGPYYGGDGRSTFGLPNLGGRVAISSGNGPGLTPTTVGEFDGADTFSLTQANLPVLRGGSSTAVPTVEESQTINFYINPVGIFPSSSGSSNTIGLIGQITAFAGNFEPNGSLLCDGRLLAIADYDALYAVIGTTYGGDGVDTFALPDLRGRTPVGTGSGVVLGQTFGSEGLTLTTANLPVEMGGSGTPISNYGPSLGISFLVAYTGIYPTRDGGSLVGDTGDPATLGEIIMFAGNVIPSGYYPADGRLLSIAQNQALFSLFGTTFGGDGRTSFALPDLRGRAVVDDSFSSTSVGQVVGSATTTLTLNDFPALSLNGTAGIDNYYGANQNDIINGNGGNDFLVGNGGDDRIDGGTGIDTMNGGSGNDTFFVDDSADVVIGGSGIDTVNASAATFSLADDTEILIYTGAGAFRGYGSAANNQITGGALDDLLKGRDGDDTLNGGNGNDSLYGGNGNDTLNGGEGNDLLVGNAGNDILNGGNGNDTLVVENTGDVANGGAGTDTVEIAAAITYAIATDVETVSNTSGGNVTVTLNALDNNYSGGSGNGVDTVFAGDGADIVYGRGGNDVLNGENGIDRLFGEAGDDQLSGGNGNDLLYGGLDNDTIAGGANDDTLYGEAGNDVLTGGTGRDLLYGGAGTDRFVFDDGDSGATLATADRIMDFASGDRIDLSAIDAVAGNAASSFSFIGTAAFSNIAGQLRYDIVGAETYIYGDTNGDGIADLLIRVQGNIALTAADFTL
jgi:microcystin-dependent protein